jgi:hypothetical protein
MWNVSRISYSQLWATSWVAAMLESRRGSGVYGDEMEARSCTNTLRGERQ